MCCMVSPEPLTPTQGSQYTGKDFIGVLQESNIRISMNGRGRVLDNVMVEARRELNKYLNCYNEKRKHSSLGKQTPDDVYFNREKETDEAA